MDWFDFLAVQGTFKSLLQHHNSKVSILHCSAFFMVQFSHLYMNTGNTIALTIETFIGKMMSLLFNTLSRFVISFLPGTKRLLISWLQLPSTVIFRAQENKICHCFHFFPLLFHYFPLFPLFPLLFPHFFISHDVMGLDAMILVFWMLCFKPAFSLSSFTLIKRLFSSSLLSASGIISICEVVDISLGSLDSSL